MAIHKETRRGANLNRASEMSFRGDQSEIAPASLAVHRIARRFGYSPEVAALVVQLAGLGSREAAR
jgi:hypothetical protein